MNDPLDVLIADGIIDEVLGRLKSGKEANISLVRRGEQVLAAKVYKDRATRSFKNNADYKEGRKVRNSRTQRAIEGGGRFGRDAAEQAWKSAEADALHKLSGRGVRVPNPVMFYEGVLLMDLVRDAEGRPAPRLIDTAIDRDAAVAVYADLVAQIISMLCCDVIHGDLSPYNILAAAEGPTIIDFPQVISAAHSSRAEYFFLRDFDNVVRFVAGFDPSLATHTADGRAIWRAYVARDLTPEFVPPPPPPPRATRGPDRRGRPDDRGRWQPRSDGRPTPRPHQGPPSPHDPNRQRPPDRRPQQQPPQRSGQRPAQDRGAQPRPDHRAPAPRHDPAARRPDDGLRQPPPARRPDDGLRRPPPARRESAPPTPAWTDNRPRAASPAAPRGGRRRPKRRW